MVSLILISTPDQVWNLTLEMLGDPDHNPCLKAKAAETKSLLPFVLELLEQSMPHVEDNDRKLQGQLLLACAREATKFDKLLRESTRILKPETLEQLLFTYKRMNVLYDRAGGIQHPKFHLMVHCIIDQQLAGNAIYYACYRDEELNGIIDKVARSCHQMVWYESVFQKLHVMRKLR